MSLEFSLALGGCKRVLAWIRVLVLSSKTRVFACAEEQPYSLPLGTNFRVFLCKGRVAWIRVLAVSSTRRTFACTKELVYNLPWFPGIQERNVSTGGQALAKTQLLLDRANALIHATEPAGQSKTEILPKITLDCGSEC